MMSTRLTVFASRTVLLAVTAIATACAAVSVNVERADTKPVVTKSVATAKPPSAGIASAHPLATEAGLEIIEQGGNAFDAAVAVAAALAVVEPYSSGVGGGGLWLLHRASDGYETMVDGREVAPLAASRDMYLDEDGEPIPRLSLDGALAAGIPGQPAGLEYISKNFGRLSFADALQPAIRYADEGFPADRRLVLGATFKKDLLAKDPEAASVFLPGGKPPVEGQLIRQPALADTLRILAEQGTDAFYRGELAKRLVKGVREAGGIWTAQDLSEYKVVERKPLVGEYRGMRIVSAPPPSSGGTVIISTLNALAEDKLEDYDPATRTHLFVEAMRRAYRDRAEYLGDPDFVDMPIERLTSPFYGQGLRASIRLDKATISSDLPGIVPTDGEKGMDTTHFSVLDTDGNRVAGTMSINFWFGSGTMAPGTGIMLNNEMDDFSIKPGVPNGYELVGAEANAIEPGKRMLSSMTPTMLEAEHGVAILGSPGGSRIISTVLVGLLEFANGANATAMTAKPRIHHQYLPDKIVYEDGALTEAEVEQLERFGHTLEQSRRMYGNMNVVTWIYDEGVTAASDPRGVGEGRIY